MCLFYDVFITNPKNILGFQLFKKKITNTKFVDLL